ncbi:MAG: hypothetical protein LBK61_01305 [Spirochaetaceae bacterium]|jgi:uncharacterized membrane protein|nr:hypothetical protein [Spirochaetaceae bacterium]
MNNHPVKKISNEDRLGVVVEQSELFLGPLPPPEVLKGYQGIDSQYPERIFKMAEEYSKAEIKSKNTESLAVILGMGFSFIVCVAGLGSCFFLALKGMTAESITAAVTGFSPILVNALANLKRPSK